MMKVGIVKMISSSNYQTLSDCKENLTTHKVMGNLNKETKQSSVHFNTLSEGQQRSCRSHISKAVHAFKCTKHSASGYSRFCLLMIESHASGMICPHK